MIKVHSIQVYIILAFIFSAEKSTSQFSKWGVEWTSGISIEDRNAPIQLHANFLIFYPSTKIDWIDYSNLSIRSNHRLSLRYSTSENFTVFGSWCRGVNDLVFAPFIINSLDSSFSDFVVERPTQRIRVPFVYQQGGIGASYRFAQRNRWTFRLGLELVLRKFKSYDDRHYVWYGSFISEPSIIQEIHRSVIHPIPENIFIGAVLHNSFEYALHPNVCALINWRFQFIPRTEDIGEFTLWQDRVRIGQQQYKMGFNQLHFDVGVVYFLAKRKETND